MKQQYNTFILIIIAISAALLGVSIALMGHHKHIALITDFYSISNGLSSEVYNFIAVAALLAIALLSIVAIKQKSLLPILGYLLIVVSLTPLLALFGNTMWIDSLGGFPAIGSGQGVIKYAALTSLGLLFIMPELPLKTKKWLSILPVLLVLIWIGGMKFTLLEAKGIEDLVASSPLMSWMYSVWDLQTTSNIIGVYDLIAVALLIGAIYNIRLLLPAIAMSGAVFVVTQTFFISWPAAVSSETLLSTGGHFLIKDLWFIANLMMFWQISNPVANDGD